jgi:hypothetical protein
MLKEHFLSQFKVCNTAEYKHYRNCPKWFKTTFFNRCEVKYSRCETSRETDF